MRNKSRRIKRIQQLWLRLSYQRLTKRAWRGFGRKRRRIGQSEVPIEVVSAITGEAARGAMRGEESRRKLIKWLSYHNMRAQVDKLILHKNSTLSRMTDDDWKEYPIILKVGSYKTPYIVDHISPRVTIKGITSCTLFLKTADNMNYLEAVAVKRKMAKGLVDAIKNDLSLAKKLARKKKKRRRFVDIDD